MDHRPFEDWLLADKQLTPEQTRELQAHLRTCASCTALTEVNLALRSAKPVAPVPGFTARFQARLAQQRKVQRRRQLWGILILVLGGLGLLLWLAAPVLVTVIRSPAEMLAAWIAYLVFILTSAQAIGEVGSILLRVVLDFVPPHAWMMAAYAFVGLSLLWVVSFWKFAKTPQGV